MGDQILLINLTMAIKFSAQGFRFAIPDLAGGQPESLSETFNINFSNESKKKSERLVHLTAPFPAQLTELTKERGSKTRRGWGKFYWIFLMEKFQ
jgi:hypothetical protein